MTSSVDLITRYTLVFPFPQQTARRKLNQAQLTRRLSDLLPNSHWGVLDLQRPPNWSPSLVHNLDLQSSQPSDVASSIHSLLDLLPSHLAFHLDVLWITPDAISTRETPVEIYGALKRAKVWHGAQVTILSAGEAVKVSENDFFADLRAQTISNAEVGRLGEFLPKNLFWRGSLSFMDEDGFQLRSLSDFRLVAEGDETMRMRLGNKRLSRHLKIVSTTAFSKISKKIIMTDKMFVLQSSSGCEIFQELLRDETLFKSGNCLVAKLQFCDADLGVMDLAASSKKKTTVEWKKAVANDTFKTHCLDENMEKALESVYFMLLPKPGCVGEAVAVMLNVSSAKCLLHEDSVNQALQSDQIAKLGSFTAERSAAEEEDSGTATEADESDWDERRLLVFLDHYAKLNKGKTAISDTMTPSGDFVVLEAKELLKHFTLDGLPRNENLEVLKPKKVVQSMSEVEDKDQMVWPHVLFLDHPGLHYNRCEQSEDADREAMRLQRVCIGTRETASTCSTQVAKQIVVTKYAKTEAAAAAVRKNAPLSKESPRKSPRKTAGRVKASQRPPPVLNKQVSMSAASSTTDNGDVYRQKLRNAVYQALKEKGIHEKHKLFRNCFRKLFEICKMYGKDMPPKIGSVKLWLNTVAKQNAETVVSLEIALNGK